MPTFRVPLYRQVYTYDHTTLAVEAATEAEAVAIALAQANDPERDEPEHYNIVSDCDDWQRNDVQPIAMEPEPCRWFALCTNSATATEAHPILGAVPICKRCKALATAHAE